MERKPSASRRASPSAKGADKTALRQRALQKTIERVDAKAKPGGNKSDAKKTAVQAGRRKQPENPLPAIHLGKPGKETDLALEPRFEAPDYKGSGKLQDQVAIITGGDSGIGRAVAVLFAREGADVAVLYLNEHDDAEITRRHVESEGRRCLVIPGDVRDSAFCDSAVGQVVAAFGRLDVLVNNAAFQLHAGRLEDLTDAHLRETLETNIGG
jgi:hypothetical protein